ncbi:protein YAE1-like [Tripterygium wilfordii]|nr:protein YAE1-like [Tripterygium wilfordii]
MQMDGKFAKELYSEALDVSKVELNPLKNSNGFDDGVCEDEDGSFSFWGGLDEDLDKDSDLDREWQRRHGQFHTIGYRDGLIAGKESSSQEGFNIGFKESVPIGYNLGLVRGVTSALACLPDKLKDRLFETQEIRDKFDDFNKSVRSLSTTDALKLFHDDILKKKEIHQSEGAGASSTSDLQEQTSNCSHLENYVGKFQSLLLESPELKVRILRD